MGIMCVKFYCIAVLRYKLSKHLNACVLDKRCSSSCEHKYTEVRIYLITLLLKQLDHFLLPCTGTYSNEYGVRQTIVLC